MKRYFILGLLSLAIMSCKKSITKPRAGIFRGTFEMTGSNGGGFETGDCTIALDDVNLSYVLNVDTGQVYPYKCYGTYVITDGTKMDFKSNSLVPVGENQDIIIDSTFNYVFDDTRLELTRTIDTIKYEYNFIRY